MPGARPRDRSGVLWAAFVAVHAWLSALAVIERGSYGFNDVTLVYDPWFTRWMSGGPLVGLQQDWVYPIGALVPIVLAGLAGPAYLLGWLIVAVLADAAAFAVLVRRRRAAWWWLGFLLALGAVAIGRIDTFAADLALVGGLWLLSRPRLAGALIAAAAWIKVWPAAVLGAALVTTSQRLRVLGGALVATAAIVVADLLLGGGAHVASFVGEQTGRGLQVEAPIASAWLVLGAAGVGGVHTAFDTRLLTYDISGQGTEAAAALSTPVMAAVLVVVLALGVLTMRIRSADAMLPSLSLGLVMALIVCNKVGSPQYVTWIAVPVVLGLVRGGRRWRVPAVLAIVVALATQLVYAGANGGVYDAMLRLEPVPVALVAARSLGCVALFGWAVADLARPLIAAARARRTIIRRRPS